MVFKTKFVYLEFCLMFKYLEDGREITRKRIEYR